MRADRLLAILLLLQRKGRVTAGDIAERLEVSVRTIYRDLEALGAAGVPVYAERGRGGGVRLLEGYTTDLTGLSLPEAELVPLLGLSGVFGGLALGASLRRAETKLLMALDDDQRGRAEAARARIHVDLRRWWDHAEPAEHLGTVADAVLSARRLRISYRRGSDGAQVDRELDPLGLVVQGGTWYLVAAVDAAEPRVYRVSRIVEAEPTGGVFDPPDGFDLRAFWEGRKEEFHETRPGYRITVRARGHALRDLTGRHGWDAHVVAEPDDGGWAIVSLSLETRWSALERVLGLGADGELLDPADLREQVISIVASMWAAYGAEANDGATARPAQGDNPSGS